jgi:hypothetical protein
MPQKTGENIWDGLWKSRGKFLVLNFCAQEIRMIPTEFPPGFPQYDTIFLCI